MYTFYKRRCGAYSEEHWCDTICVQRGGMRGGGRRRRAAIDVHGRKLEQVQVCWEAYLPSPSARRESGRVVQWERVGRGTEHDVMLVGVHERVEAA